LKSQLIRYIELEPEDGEWAIRVLLENSDTPTAHLLQLTQTMRTAAPDRVKDIDALELQIKSSEAQ
jgi:hypothetical protein